MRILLLIVEFIAAIGLVLTILLHSPKGEGLGSIGGQAKLFSASSGLESSLNKITATLAAVFLVVAVILSNFF